MHHKSQPSSAPLHAILQGQTCRWLKGHGKAVAPRLSDAQQQELHDCFKLMDLDGSGSIGLSELKAAFKLLGINMTPKQAEAVLHAADTSGDGELDYREFLQVMTNTLKKLTTDKATSSHTTKLPFGLIATAYRRKRYLENLLHNDRQAVSQMVSMAITGDRPWQVGVGIDDQTFKTENGDIAVQESDKARYQVTTHTKRLGALLAYPDLNMISQLDGFQQQLLVQEARRLLGVCQACGNNTMGPAADIASNVAPSSCPQSPRYHSIKAQMAVGQRQHTTTGSPRHNRSTAVSPRRWCHSPSTSSPACSPRPDSPRHLSSSPYSTPRAKQSSASPYATQTSPTAANIGKRPVGSILATPRASAATSPQMYDASWGCVNGPISKALDAILTPRAKPCCAHHASHQQLLDSPRVRATTIFCSTNVASLPRSARPTSAAAASAARASREQYYQQQRHEVDIPQHAEAADEGNSTLQPQSITAKAQQETPGHGNPAALSIRPPGQPIVPPLALSRLLVPDDDVQQCSISQGGTAAGYGTEGSSAEQGDDAPSCLSHRGQSLLPYAASPRGFAGYMRNARKHAHHVVECTNTSQRKQEPSTKR